MARQQAAVAVDEDEGGLGAAAVDAEDKVANYRNWLGLMRGDLADTFEKGGRQMTRRLAEDVTYTDPQGNEVTHPGRAVLLVRNVGHLMTTPAVCLPDGAQAPEGWVDAVITSLIGLVDVQGRGAFRRAAEEDVPRVARGETLRVVDERTREAQGERPRRLAEAQRRREGGAHLVGGGRHDPLGGDGVLLGQREGRDRALRRRDGEQ